MSDLISIGKILNFHGIKGEVKVGYTAGREDLVKSLKSVFVSVSDERKLLTVESVRFHKQFALIKFKEINSVNDAEIYKGKDISVYRSEISKFLSENEYLISDLIGKVVYSSDDEKIGVISDVGSNNAGELLQIKDYNGNLHLVPFVKEIVPVVDIEKGYIVINNIKGLIE